MDELETILTFMTDLQNDETLDLSSYASRFVEVSEAHDSIVAIVENGASEGEANAQLINDLKSENWDLSKKITTKETVDEEPDESESKAEEETEEEFESTDDAIDDLFKKDKEKDDEK